MRRSPRPATSAGGRRSVYAVILAGGGGTRLWPLVGPDRPKPFLSIRGRQSLFQQTLRRVLPLVGRDRILVVAGREHDHWIRGQAAFLRPWQVILEGAGRNTAAAVGLAAHRLLDRDPGAIMIVLPADHWIEPPGRFRGTLARAVRAAATTGGLVTLGLPALRPDTGMGYIRPDPGRTANTGAKQVVAFIEKPDRVRAARMIAGGRWRWNSGIFVWRASAILAALRLHAPSIATSVARWARRGGGRWSVPATVMRRIPALPIDRAVLERSSDVWMVEAPFRWSDVGSWDAVAALGPRDPSGNGGWERILAVDSERCFGVSDAGIVAFVGVRDIVAVRAGAAVLVCRRGATQAVRTIAAVLASTGSGGTPERRR